ncbi:MAG: hypothetical protein DYG92_00225 [Leptolyngbya sp. PLA1]|nr:hypothetical protein [Leptolyngbya sp. PLA1]
MSKPLLWRALWTLWAIAPVVAAAYHFGPGQKHYLADRAAGVLARAEREQQDAMTLQETAYQSHLRALEARAAAFGSDDPTLHDKAKHAGAVEQDAYAAAATAWQRVADTLGGAEALIDDQDHSLRQRVRVSRGRALVRAGSVGSGAEVLEGLLEEFTASRAPDPSLERQVREELATAYYYGARLMRLGGRPAPEWKEISGRAAQQYRYLAETARARGEDSEALNQQKNVELVLNLEQSSLDELFAKARPKDSPTGSGRIGTEPRPGSRGRRRGDRPGGGAGLDGEIGQGW